MRAARQSVWTRGTPARPLVGVASWAMLCAACIIATPLSCFADSDQSDETPVPSCQPQNSGADRQPPGQPYFVRFNQHWLERRWAASPWLDSLAETSLARRWRTMVESLRWHALPKEHRRAAFGDWPWEPAPLVTAVLQQAPEPIVVYPSERYYYFTIKASDLYVSGNLRFTDVEEGVLHTGAFRVGETYDFVAETFDHRSGSVHIEPSGTPDPRGPTYTLRFGDVVRTVVLVEPQQPAESSEAPFLEWRFVSPIVDESGVVFDLFFDAERKRFAYLLRESATAPSPESLIPIEDRGMLPAGMSLWRAPQSAFVFLRGAVPGRALLVGVAHRNVRLNNYFDGPFDQVPPRLPLRDMLYAAYPYTQIGRGLDPHGRFIGQDGVRVAISPYHTYRSPSGLIRHVAERVDATATGPGRFLAVVEEAKNGFHRLLRARGGAGGDRHALERSRLWPVGHWVEQSNARTPQR